jgi:hypothetical protein
MHILDIASHQETTILFSRSRKALLTYIIGIYYIRRKMFMSFFNSAVDVLQTLVIALGAGLAIWGAINLLEGTATTIQVQMGRAHKEATTTR